MDLSVMHKEKADRCPNEIKMSVTSEWLVEQLELATTTLSTGHVLHENFFSVLNSLLIGIVSHLENNAFMYLKSLYVINSFSFTTQLVNIFNILFPDFDFLGLNVLKKIVNQKVK